MDLGLDARCQGQHDEVLKACSHETGRFRHHLQHHEKHMQVISSDAHPVQLSFNFLRKGFAYVISVRFYVSSDKGVFLTCCAFCVSNTIFEALKTQEEELQQAEDKLRQAGSGVWIYGEVLRTNLVMSGMQFSVPSREHWKYCRVLHLAQEAKVISKNLDGETLERKAFLKFTILVVNFRIREIFLPLVT